MQKRKGHNLKYESYERKNLIGKGKYTVNVGDQQLMKLLRMLKNKSGKIIYPQVIKV